MSFEDSQRALDPHRDAELHSVEAEATDRLRRRGVHLTGRESPDEMADLLDAVERFEAAVEAHGGDLFVDTPTRPRDTTAVERPDNPAFVLPARRADERVSDYIARIEAAADHLG